MPYPILDFFQQSIVSFIFDISENKLKIITIFSKGNHFSTIRINRIDNISFFPQWGGYLKLRIVKISYRYACGQFTSLLKVLDHYQMQCHHVFHHVMNKTHIIVFFLISFIIVLMNKRNQTYLSIIDKTWFDLASSQIRVFSSTFLRGCVDRLSKLYLLRLVCYLGKFLHF